MILNCENHDNRHIIEKNDDINDENIQFSFYSIALSLLSGTTVETFLVCFGYSIDQLLCGLVVWIIIMSQIFLNLLSLGTFILRRKNAFCEIQSLSFSSVSVFVACDGSIVVFMRLGHYCCSLCEKWSNRNGYYFLYRSCFRILTGILLKRIFLFSFYDFLYYKLLFNLLCKFFAC